MPEVNTKFSVSTFHQCDGTNFTTAGVDNSVKLGNGNLGTYTGIGLTFDGKPSSAVIDLKGTVQYGDSPISGGFRIRNNLNESSQTVQFRIQPCTVTVPVTSKTSIYTTPYAATKVNYKTGYNKNKITFGNYTGISTKIGKASVFIEGQIYDITKINKNTTSINAGVSIPL